MSTTAAMTTSQAARTLGISRQHTIRLAREGRLAHYWTPLGRLFPADEVERLAEQRTATTASAAIRVG